MSPWSLDLLSADSSSCLSLYGSLTFRLILISLLCSAFRNVDYSFLSYVVFKVLAGFSQQLFIP